MRGKELCFVGQFEDLLVQTLIEERSQLLGGVAMRKVGTANIAHEKSVTGKQGARA
jgi:hypothetical protein